MSARLFVGVLGHRDSGKSKTWESLFGSTVKTGQYARTLMLYGGECTEVFLINGSPEERGLNVSDILGENKYQIVLCSIQYSRAAWQTLQYVIDNKFDFFVQWLNPGWSDAGENYDRLGIIPWLLGHEVTVAMRNGKTDPQARTEEIRQFVHGWAKAQNFTFNCP